MLFGIYYAGSCCEFCTFTISEISYRLQYFTWKHCYDINILFLYTAWACDEVFTTRDHPFVIECESDWKLVETFFIGLVNEYLSSGKYAGKLKEYQAIGIGFVDGDLHILYAR